MQESNNPSALAMQLLVTIDVIIKLISLNGNGWIRMTNYSVVFWWEANTHSIMVMAKYLIWASEMAYFGSCDQY